MKTTFFLLFTELFVLITTATQAQSNSECQRDPNRRQAVTNTLDTPYRWIGHLTVHRNNKGQHPSTCFLVTPKGLITAGHSVRSWFLNRVVQIDITMAAQSPSDSQNPFPTLTYRRDQKQFKATVPFWFYIRGLRKLFGKKGPAYDYGVIRLADNRLFEQVGGHFPWDANTLPKLADSSTVHIASYPCDKPKKTMWRESGQALVWEQIINYNLFTMQGSSGAPVWVMNNGIPVVVAVHNNGPKPQVECQPPTQVQSLTGCGSSARMSPNRYRKIAEWLKRPL